MSPSSVLPTAEAARQSAHQGVFEGISEVAVKVGVYQRVERRIEVTYPEQDADHDVGRFAGLAAHVGGDVPVGKPTRLEHALICTGTNLCHCTGQASP